MLCFLPPTHYPLNDFGLRAAHARTLLPAALASVSFGFVLVRVCLVIQNSGDTANYRSVQYLQLPSTMRLSASFDRHQ